MKEARIQTKIQNTKIQGQKGRHDLQCVETRLSLILDDLLGSRFYSFSGTVSSCEAKTTEREEKGATVPRCLLVVIDDEFEERKSYSTDMFEKKNWRQ